MAKPILFTVDDEPHVLSAVGRDLRQKYGQDYRIMKASSGAEALETIRQLKQRDEAIALFLVDQRMPEMSGTQFLSQALTFFPEARKVLLTAYADTEAAIASINSIGLDYYLMKPWDPPEQNLYPVLDDLLFDWAATVPLPYAGIRVAGTLWSAGSHAVKDFLARNQVPYQWLDIESNEEAQTLVDAATAGNGRLPVVFFPDGDVLIEPTPQTLADKIGMRTQATEPFYDLIIIGAGPAGLGAAVYGGSEGLRTLMIEKAATGGQAGTSSRIENYLGFPKGLSGADLARRATAQARRFGVEILVPQEVVQVRIEDPYRLVRLADGTELGCKALLVASGATVRQLDAPGMANLTGAGVYYGAAITEAAHYRDRHIFVVGGANSAGQGAMFFARYAQQVTILVRGSSLEKGMSHYLVQQIYHQPNIDVCVNTVVTEVFGEQRLERLTTLNTVTREAQTVPADALFLFIGAVPHSDMVAGVVERNNAGFILTGTDLLKNGRRPQGWASKRDPFLLESSVPGIFAAGDARAGSTKQVASAAGEGATAALLIREYLKTV